MMRRLGDRLRPVGRQLRLLLPSGLAAAAAVGLAVVLLVILGPVAWLVAGSTVRGIPDPKSRADAINTVRSSLLTASAGIIAGVALYFTARNYYLSRRGQVADRYTKAITLLSSDKAAERIGGIYALEHILRESPIDHSTVVDVLAAYVRDRAPARKDPRGRSRVRWRSGLGLSQLTTADPAPKRQRPAADVQAALTVLGRRPERAEVTRLDLRGTDLRGAELQGARLSNALLQSSKLQHSDLGAADLRNADLAQAHMQGAFLAMALLQGAQLSEAQLQDANLEWADLRSVRLSRTQLRGANLGGAGLQGAILDEADLRGVIDLTQNELQLAFWEKSSPPLLDKEYRSRPDLQRSKEGP